MNADAEYEYIVVTLTPDEEAFVDRVVNAIYYTAISLIAVLGLVWLSRRPHK